MRYIKTSFYYYRTLECEVTRSKGSLTEVKENLSLAESCTWPVRMHVSIESIEYDVTIQKPALQHGVCECVRVGVRTCAIEIKPGTLCAT